MSGLLLRLSRLDLGVRDDPATIRERAALVRRGAVPDPVVRDGARRILEDVRAGGAAAVIAANARYGGGLADGRLVLERAALDAARDRLDSRTRAALERAIANVRRLAEASRPVPTNTETSPGVAIERRWVPLDRVGCYVPGGLAPLPSSLVMTAVPAAVAGVGTIIAATPAAAGGAVDPTVLGAAGLLEIDALVVAGGAQAIGALAYGIPDAGMPPVDRIVGPGGPWVTAAKIEVMGDVGIDMPAGPSEGMVLADASADPATVAADLITQAEHGPDSPALLVTTDAALADAVERALNDQLERLSRRAILERSLGEFGRIVLAPSRDEAIRFVNDYAPEHLSIDMVDVEVVAGEIRNAGSVFIGRWAPESAGDYATGANHVLPTGGLARCCGALSIESYGRFVQFQRLTRDGLASLRETIGVLARAEGLDAHRAAVEIRFDREAG